MNRDELIDHFNQTGKWLDEGLSEEERFLLTSEARDKLHQQSSSAPRITAKGSESRLDGLTDQEKLEQLVAIGQGESFGAQALRSRISMQGQARYLAEQLAQLSNPEASSPTSEAKEEPAYVQHLAELNQLVGGAKIARARELGLA